MPTTDTSEKGLETLIAESLVREAGYELGRYENYDREHAVNMVNLLAFLHATQLDAVTATGIDAEGPKRNQFLTRLQGEIAKRGIIDVLRTGVRHGPASFDLFYARHRRGIRRRANGSRPISSA